MESGRRITIEGADHHYLARVLRVARGDRLPAGDTGGNDVILEVVERAADHLVAEVVSVERAPAGRIRAEEGAVGHHGPLPELHLYQCLLKGSRMDMVVRQATELGVTSLIPVVSRFTVARWSGGPGDHRVERWRRISRQAMQQSGRTFPPGITEPVTMESVIAAGPRGTGLVFHQEQAGSTPLVRLLRNVEREVSLVIGPEGGLSGEELRALREAGFQPAWLGPTVLRGETAAAVAVGVVAALLRERESWEDGGERGTE